MSGIVPVIGGNILGYWLDRNSISLKIRSRVAFWTLVIIQGAWWTWATVLVTRFKETKPTFDWTTPGFGAAFGVFVFLAMGFQLNYLFLYFIVHNIAESDEEIIRYAALIRGTESAWEALSYGLESLTLFTEAGGVYMSFAIWAVAIYPAWHLLRHFGVHRPLVGDESYPASIERVDEKGVISSGTSSGDEAGNEKTVEA
ncbi:hypothetical protein N0V85_003368 [Neurospora sp. IMI 360204]|nr:hypothetical protein N0V85_003368 [Neurospora sp. IMI 360204]